jgi:hypothetical protein
MFIKYIENFLTIEECEKIILFGNSGDLIQMKSSLIVNNKIVNQNIEYEGNKRIGCYFVQESLKNPLIQSVSEKIINLSNELNPFNGITYNEIPKYSFNRYGVGDFLDWHSDNHEIINGATITYIIQLNDNYSGGDVKYSINNETHTIKKKQGSVFIFDSNLSHSVDKVSDGIRYSINVWPSKTIKKSLI